MVTKVVFENETYRLLDVSTAIRLSKAVIRNIKQNLFRAFIYNIIGIPVAAGLFFIPFAPKLNPMIGAFAMSFSSVFVVTNALRPRWFQPKHTAHKNNNAPAGPAAQVKLSHSAADEVFKAAIEDAGYRLVAIQ